MRAVGKKPVDYVIRLLATPAGIDGAQWDALLAAQATPTPFLSAAYLQALDASGSAVADTGWTPQFLTLWQGDRLQAACPVYLKTHSWGEYVFDFAWADAYRRAGLAYYPKALVAVPFAPVPGTRLLAVDERARSALLDALLAWCKQVGLSSLHLLFLDERDQAACEAAGLQLRHGVQFHWENAGYPSFDDFLARLSQDKRKKIRQEQRKVAEAGVRFEAFRGKEISSAHWDFFYECYERTYLAHGNAPYLSRDFFARMAGDMPGTWLMFLALRGGRPVGCSLIALSETHAGKVAYGRYWGALERVDCLHFDACYYQPLRWCIEHGFDRFEGGAQGEHKMARALMPVRTTSAHWLAHPAFADAVGNFLEQESRGVDRYLSHLDERSPFRREPPG